jgi:hypothetical protein
MFASVLATYKGFVVFVLLYVIFDWTGNLKAIPIYVHLENFHVRVTVVLKRTFQSFSRLGYVRKVVLTMKCVRIVAH